MAPDRVLTGANILSEGVRRDNFFARWIRAKMLEHKVLSKREDSAWGFQRGLRDVVWEVETWAVGSVSIFGPVGPSVMVHADDRSMGNACFGRLRHGGDSGNLNKRLGSALAPRVRCCRVIDNVPSNPDCRSVHALRRILIPRMKPEGGGREVGLVGDLMWKVLV